MGRAVVGDVELWYETLGEDDDPPLLLVSGLGGQAIGWPDAFCWGLVSRGFRVIRFDNRDAGLSTALDHVPVDIAAAAHTFLSGGVIDAPYGLVDMAADAVGLLDALDIPRAHVLGSSLGGMIAQTMAIHFPDRVASLTSLMATTGERDLLLPDPEVMGLLLEPAGEDRDAAVAAARRWAEALGSPGQVDLDAVVDLAHRAYERAHRPMGTARQLLAIVSSPSRAEQLARLTVPTLVVHGSVDRLIRPEAGRRTAELVPGAELLELEDVGHDLPQSVWAQLIERVTALAVRAGP